MDVTHTPEGSWFIGANIEAVLKYFLDDIGEAGYTQISGRLTYEPAIGSFWYVEATCPDTLERCAWEIQGYYSMTPEQYMRTRSAYTRAVTQMILKGRGA